MLAVKGTILVQLQLTLDVLAVLVGGIILALALAALQGDDFDSGLFLASHFLSPKTKNTGWTADGRKASERDRTADLNLTMVALCRLSYRGETVKTTGFKTILTNGFFVKRRHKGNLMKFDKKNLGYDAFQEIH